MLNNSVENKWLVDPTLRQHLENRLMRFSKLRLNLC